MNNLGWECPKCHTCYNPNVTKCNCITFKQDYLWHKNWLGYPIHYEEFCVTRSFNEEEIKRICDAMDKLSQSNKNDN